MPPLAAGRATLSAMSSDAPHTRLAALSVVLVAALATSGVAAAKPDPPKPPKPKVTLLTANEDGALRHEAIKAEVLAKRGKQVRAKAQLVVDGYPDDFSFRLGPVDAKVRDRQAKLRFELSPRQLEVLDFAAQTCRSATISVSAKAAGRVGTTSGALAVPGDC